MSIPKDIDEAVRSLRLLLPESQLRKFAALPEEEARVSAHFGIGLFIRNNWLYPQGSPLMASLMAEDAYFFDADSASDLVVRALWRNLRALG